MKRFISLFIIIYVSSCSIDEKKSNYKTDSNEAVSFIYFLSSIHIQSELLLENALFLKLKAAEWQIVYFYEDPFDSSYSLEFHLRDMDEPFFPEIKTRGFTVLIDSSGNMHHKSKLYSAERMAALYWHYYRPKGIKPLKKSDWAEKKLLRFDDIGSVICSGGHLEMKVELPNSDESIMRIAQSMRQFYRNVFKYHIQYRNNLSQKFYGRMHHQLEKSQWIQIVLASSFYSQMTFLGEKHMKQ